jgi:hypothetical protein
MVPGEHVATEELGGAREPVCGFLEPIITRRYGGLGEGDPSGETPPFLAFLQDGPAARQVSDGGVQAAGPGQEEGQIGPGAQLESPLTTVDGDGQRLGVEGLRVRRVPVDTAKHRQCIGSDPFVAAVASATVLLALGGPEARRLVKAPLPEGQMGCGVLGRGDLVLKRRACAS